MAQSNKAWVAGVCSRDTLRSSKNVENKGLDDCVINLLNNDYVFKEVLSNKQKRCYTYEVNLLIVNNFYCKNNVEYRKIVENYIDREDQRLERIKYDTDINIRDTYPLEKYIENKNSIDISHFNILNDMILNFNSRITRRVTKKRIVYKIDKCKNIVAIDIKKINYINLFFAPSIIDKKYDDVLVKVPENSRMPLCRKFIIKDASGLDLAKEMLDEYLKKAI